MIWAVGALVDLSHVDVSDDETIIRSFCIFGWEWLLCLPQEYERIWKRPMNVSIVRKLLVAWVLTIATQFSSLLYLGSSFTIDQINESPY